MAYKVVCNTAGDCLFLYGHVCKHDKCWWRREMEFANEMGQVK